MRVLLTRAAEDAARTRATLEQLGHQVLVSPVIAYEATGAPWPVGTIDALVATSAQAFAALNRAAGPTLEARSRLPLWLVGRRTEEAARLQGFRGASFVAQDAATLAANLVKAVDPMRIVYLAGRDRKPTLEAAIATHARHLEVVETYQAVAASGLDPATADALKTGTLDAVLHFSRRSAILFIALAAPEAGASHIHHICLSHDVAAPLREKGWPVRVADRPTEPELISCLRRTAT